MAWSKDASDASTEVFNNTSFIPVSGTGARSVVFWFKTSETYTADRYMSGWGDTSTGAAYRWRLDHGNSYRFRVEVVGGQVTFSQSGLNDGAWHCVAFGTPSGGNITATTCYIDGVSQSVNASSSRAMNTGTGKPIILGYDKVSLTAGPDCEYAELAVFNRLLSAEEMKGLTSGISPACYPNGLVMYWPLIRDIVSRDGNTRAEATGTWSITAHPRVIYPSAQILQFPPTAAGGGGPSVNINGSTVNWNGLTSYNWNGVA